MATAHFDIQPEDGWVKVADGSVDFIAIKQFPTNQVFYVTTGSSTPAANTVGFRVDCEQFWADVTIADNFYVRTDRPVQGEGTRIFVFTVPTPSGP